MKGGTFTLLCGRETSNCSMLFAARLVKWFCEFCEVFSSNSSSRHYGSSCEHPTDGGPWGLTELNPTEKRSEQGVWCWFGVLVTRGCGFSLQWGRAVDRESGAWIRKNWKGSRSGCHGSNWLDCEFMLWGLLFWKLLLHLLFGKNFQGNLPSSHILANYMYVMSVLSVLVADGKQRYLLDSFLKKRKKTLSSYWVGSILWRKFKKLINYNKISPL